MNKRLLLISIVILLSLCGLCGLGFHSISLHAEGLAAKRIADFTDVAEQVRIDIKRKLDKFIETEQKRPYTDYRYFYVPLASNDQQAFVRSPLAGSLSHGLAFGHFQIESDGSIVTPFYKPDQSEPPQPELQNYIANIKQNLLTALNGNGPGIGALTVRRTSIKLPTPKEDLDFNEEKDMHLGKKIAEVQEKKELRSQKGSRRSGKRRGKSYPIESLAKQQQQVQVLNQSRAYVTDNTSVDKLQFAGADEKSNKRQLQRTEAESPPAMMMPGGIMPPPMEPEPTKELDAAGQRDDRIRGGRDLRRDRPVDSQIIQTEETAFQTALSAGDFADTETVQIRIEPFSSVVIAGGSGEKSIFPRQVFLLRHIQIERNHFLQGFKLNQAELTEQITESASRLIRRGMGFELSRDENPNAAHVAILDFGFGEIALNLLELDPHWITTQISQLRNWYFAIVAIVFIAVMIALISLWRNVRSQGELIRKKDDFLSAVSHELRTPLTTIRMHTEMLEKDWIRSEDKRSQYYTTMRQESERLSRLIENVLDFSRIQRGRKKYVFTLGDINHCIGRVINTMIPFAKKAGFNIKTDFNHIPPTTFDSDAVMQIVINLIDNAVKYASQSVDKTITVRTRWDKQYIIIEVEDHGPGVPHLQRKKIFDEFYRIGDESTRQTTGTGLGLALVKKFAQAHNGFVEIAVAKPTGAIFRVALAGKM